MHFENFAMITVEKLGLTHPGAAVLSFNVSTELFSRKALRSQGDQFAGQILLIDHARSQRGPLLVALVATAALCGALFVPMSKTLSVEGMLRPEAGSFQLVAGRSGTIVRQLANVGDVVSRGQALLLISAELATTADGESLAAIPDGIRRRLASLQEEQTSQERLDQMQLAKLTHRLRAKEGEALALAHSISEAQARVVIRKAAVQRYIGLEGFFPEGQIDQQRDALLQQQQAYNELRRQRLVVVAESEELRNDIRLKPLEARQAAAARTRELIKLNEDLTDAELRRSVIVRAPTDGVVASIPNDAGRSVGAQDVVVTIVPHASHLIAEFAVPDHAMAGAISNARMSLRLESFPYEKYGQLGAVVTSLSGEPQATAKSRAFVGRARLDQQQIVLDGKPAQLLPGMKFSGSIKSDSRRLWQWIVEPLLRSEGLR
jgi:membrane fusion protein